jgi:hypothetical protein
MNKRKRLSSAYQFPGFIPEENIRGVFGDPQAMVIRLKRIEKKRYAQNA